MMESRQAPPQNCIIRENTHQNTLFFSLISQLEAHRGVFSLCSHPGLGRQAEPWHATVSVDVSSVASSSAERASSPAGWASSAGQAPVFPATIPRGWSVRSGRARHCPSLL